MNFRKVMVVAFAVAAFISISSASAAMSDKEKQKARADLDKMERETLSQLYKVQPGAKATVTKAAGYAVFSNFGMKILIAGSGKGAGVAVNKASGKKTYMKMVEVQAGLGFGIKKFRLVWVFDSEKSLSSFINSGWETGGQASMAAKSGSKGDAYAGAVAVSPGVWVYQIAGDGLALELTAKGTKYYKDDDLN